MADRDYTGVSTRDLAKAINASVKNVDTWAIANGLDTRVVYRIRDEEYQFTGLGIADRVCVALGKNVSLIMPVIPAHGRRAAARMAEDEAYVHGHDADWVKARTDELVKLRRDVLGDPTPEQLERLAWDSLRIKQRQAKKREMKWSPSTGDSTPV